MQVTLYSREGCHLCEDALAVLRRLRRGKRFDLKVVDVDADDELAARYGARVPVVVVDGAEVAEGIIDDAALQGALA